MIAVSINLSTESGDTYHFLSDHERIVKEVLDNLAEEIEYVQGMSIEVYPYDSAVYNNVRQKLNEARGNV